MPDGITWRENIKLEKEKIKGMNNKQRWNYFVSYYLLKLVIILALSLIFISMVKEYISNSREVLISGCMVNTYISDEGYQCLTDDYFKYRDGNNKKQVVQLAKDNYIDFSGKNPEMEGDSRELALFSQMSAGEMDYLIVDKEAFDSINRMDVYADLNQLLSPQIREKLGDCLVNQKTVDSQNEYAAGIDLSKIALTQKLGIEPKDVYLVFIDVDSSQERVDSFLNYLIQLK